MSLGEQLYTFVIIKNPKQNNKEEPYLFFISDLQDARAIASHYFKRWKIECCFKHLKKNGFNIEDINLKSDIKIELMMGVLACTYIMAIMEGIIKQIDFPPGLKIYKNGKQYPSISIFRSGYIELQQLFMNVLNVLDYLADCFRNWIPEPYEGYKPDFLMQNV